MVAIATIFRNDGSKRSRPVASRSACAILKATPAPQSDLHGILATGLVGIDDGNGLGDALRLRQVMVGDDEIDATALGCLGGGEGADAGVNADDEADAAGRGFAR